MSKFQVALMVGALLHPLGAQGWDNFQTNELDTALTGGYLRIVDAQVENLHCGDVEQARQLEAILMSLARTVLTNHDTYQKKIEAIQSIRAVRKSFWNMGDISKCNHERMDITNARAYDQLKEISRLSKQYLHSIK